MNSIDNFGVRLVASLEQKIEQLIQGDSHVSPVVLEQVLTMLDRDYLYLISQANQMDPYLEFLREKGFGKNGYHLVDSVLTASIEDRIVDFEFLEKFLRHALTSVFLAYAEHRKSRRSSVVPAIKSETVKNWTANLLKSRSSWQIAPDGVLGNVHSLEAYTILIELAIIESEPPFTDLEKLHFESYFTDLQLRNRSALDMLRDGIDLCSIEAAFKKNWKEYLMECKQ